MSEASHAGDRADGQSHRRFLAIAAATAAVAVLLLGLDLVWLGVVAKGLYDRALGPLLREPVHWPAALGFYGFYVGAIVATAVATARSVRVAAARGAALGLIVYASYELTNLAVIAGWPASLVPVDVAWGVALTGSVSAGGAWVKLRVMDRR
ncbi:MAG: DUF2177 family protein [Planctomycetota bacterium]|nr:MAG: DUF2177 family protein [Planctomycetota bacterium]